MVINLQENFVTITGTIYKYGSSPIKAGQIVKLIKDAENMFDTNAIAVTLPGLGKVGYVANSKHTVLSGTKSADEIYSTFENECFCKIIKKEPKSLIGKIL